MFGTRTTNIKQNVQMELSHGILRWTTPSKAGTDHSRYVERTLLTLSMEKANGTTLILTPLVAGGGKKILIQRQLLFSSETWAVTMDANGV